MVTTQDYAGFSAADQSVTSSTTLVTATGLSQPVEASRGYGFQAVIMFNLAGVVSGMKFSVSTPASPTNLAYLIEILNGTGLSVAALGLSAPVAGALATTGLHIARFFGTLENGSNAGNLLLQFAQNTSDASAITVKRGSWFRVWPL